MFMDARMPPEDIAGYKPIATAGDAYSYDSEAADKSVEFFPKLLRHIKGPRANEPFHLEPFQQDVNRTIFGWRDSRGVRRYRTVFIILPRKNGKSTWLAGIGNYVLFADGEGGAECYCSASDREQASLVFNLSASMIRKAPSLEKHCKIRDSTKRIMYGDSFLRAIPANEGGSHGFNSHLIIGDELHAWPGREFYDVLHTSTGAREQPLEIYITTAGFDRNSVCYEIYEYAKSVRDGKIEDPSFLPVIYEAEESDDWTDPEIWKKANPNIGVSVSTEYIERECKRAQKNPAIENTFRRLHLNQWTSQETRWLQMDHWRKCDSTAGEMPLDGYQIGGLDLSAVSDFTAWMRVQRTETGIACRGHYFIPEEKADEYRRTSNMPIEKWVRDGWLTVIPGRRIEHGYIHNRITEDCKKHKIRAIGFDPWNMEQLRQDLEGKGHEMVEVRQGYASLSSPSKELERQVLAHTLDHGNDPILEWMADNAVCKIDENGNVRPVKGKGKHKIDGVVALIIAINVLQALEPVFVSAYEQPGMLML